MLPRAEELRRLTLAAVHGAHAQGWQADRPGRAWLAEREEGMGWMFVCVRAWREVTERARAGTRRVVWDGEAAAPRERAHEDREDDTEEAAQWVQVRVTTQEGSSSTVKMQQQQW